MTPAPLGRRLRRGAPDSRIRRMHRIGPIRCIRFTPRPWCRPGRASPSARTMTIPICPYRRAPASLHASARN